MGDVGCQLMEHTVCVSKDIVTKGVKCKFSVSTEKRNDQHGSEDEQQNKSDNSSPTGSIVGGAVGGVIVVIVVIIFIVLMIRKRSSKSLSLDNPIYKSEPPAINIASYKSENSTAHPSGLPPPASV
jgi:hypothetical protein